MALGNTEIISREVEKQLSVSLDKRFDAFSAQFMEELALIGERIDKVDNRLDKLEQKFDKFAEDTNIGFSLTRKALSGITDIIKTLSKPV